MEIGQAIKELRKRNGINQGDFADKIGISQTALSQIESNKKHPSSTTRYKIAKALDIPETIIYLLCIKEEDISDNKKDIYKILYPTIKEMIFRFL